MKPRPKETVMRLIVCFLTAALLLVPAVAQGAEEASLDFGGDHYGAGQSVDATAPIARDAFLAGSDVTLGASVGGDAHLAGFTVRSAGPVAGDLYAVGFSVTVTGSVGGDVTAAGNSVSLSGAGPIAGNVRAAGQTVTIDAPITGSALLSGATLNLNSQVSGDLTLVAETVSFGAAARVSGKVSIMSSQEIAVPESVASADRVSFTKVSSPDYVSQAGRTADTVVGKFWPAVWGAVISWVVLFVIGLIFIVFMPRVMAALRQATARPFRTFGFGILAFAAVLGLLPVVAMTLIGLILVPVVLVFIVVAWALAYLSGVYFVGLRIAATFMPVETTAARAGVLLGSLVVAGLLTMIPIVGWLLMLVLVAFGCGTVALAIFRPRGGPAIPTAAGTPAAA
jgi:cytoskeletal protein CcmA (bactofilin family)